MHKPKISIEIRFYDLIGLLVVGLLLLTAVLLLR